MDSLFDTRGKLEFVVARGWMSPYEAASLKAGDVVVSSGTAGTEGELIFNGEFLASAALVVSGAGESPAYFAARIPCGRARGFTRPAAFHPEPEPGPALADLLPFSLVAAKMECPLSALEGAGPGSLLRFDTPFGAPSAVELRILGIPAARGPLAVRGEFYGMKTEELLRAPFPIREPRLTGALLSPPQGAVGPDSAAPFKIYDVRRPDAVTRMTVNALVRIHVRFMENLRARYPFFDGYALASVDQMTAAEWFADFPRGGRRTIEAEAGRRRRDYGMDEEDDGEIKIIEGPCHPAPLDRDSRAEILAGLRSLRDRDRQGPAMVQLPADLGVGAVDFFACLRGSWNLVADLAFREARDVPALRTEARGEDAFVPNEMVVSVRFERPDSPAVDMAYSLRSIAVQIPALESYGRVPL